MWVWCVEAAVGEFEYGVGNAQRPGGTELLGTQGSLLQVTHV